ncbi:MAG: ribosome biogenesis GTP-binding protein YsxC [Deltaproteobacteria bacterium]|nr:ribosome biogenesis GTP-binding protein YsxC [Deltaproteobacteria bacterium]
MPEGRDQFVVEDARFSLSVGDPRALPPPLPRELCVVGRSNVGKSSLINLLLERRELARTARAPGRTRLVNFFSVRLRRARLRPCELNVVDLPGYGFARLSASEQRRVEALLGAYLSGGRGQGAALQLIDCRRQVEELDVDIQRRLAGAGFATVVAATKIDKLAKSRRVGVARRLSAAFVGAPVVLTSAADRIGRAELWSELWRALRL